MTRELDSEHIKALVAAAYEAAAQYHDYHAQYYRSGPDKAAHEEHARRIRALTPDDALSTFNEIVLVAVRTDRERLAVEADARRAEFLEGSGIDDWEDGYCFAMRTMAEEIRKGGDDD